MYLLVMSPSQSGLSWRIFSSARDLFHFSSKSKISIENEPKFDSQLKIYYFWLILIINLYWKWLNYADKSYYSTPFVLKNSNKWSWNWLESYIIGAKMENLICDFLTYILSELTYARKKAIFWFTLSGPILHFTANL